jgi:hypothetical protein
VLTVKSFSLVDHQFVHIKLVVKGGKEIELWIPRIIVIAIAQGKTDLSAAFSFAGTKTK